MTSNLFVYGTLMRGYEHPMARLLSANADYLGEATCRGRLYMVKHYPGLALSEAAVASELAEVFGDCEWGAAPPFGRLYGLQTLLEDGISPESELVFETHSHMEAVRIRCADFERLEKPLRLPFSKPA